MTSRSLRCFAAIAALTLAACSSNPEASKPAARDTPASGPERPAGPARDGAHGLPKGALHAQRVAVMDMNGFEQPLPAQFALIPIGWQTSGGVTWGREHLCTNGYNFTWAARSPDGAQTVAILPQQKWEANNYGAGVSSPGCAAASIDTVQQYLVSVVSRFQPGARVLTYQPRPDLTAQIAHLNQATPTAMGEMRTWAECGEVPIAYQEQNREMRGVAVACVAFSLMRTRGLAPGQSLDALTGFAFPGFAASGPADLFDAQLAETIRQSFLPNPAWQANITRHNTAIARVAAAEIAKQAKMIAETNDYISLLRKQTAETAARSDARRQRQFGEVIRGTTTYDDPNAAGGQVELSHLYDHAWRLNDGSYVLSNDASFEPFRDLGVDGQRLERTP